MIKRFRKKIIIAFSIILGFTGLILPLRVSGEVKPITETEDKLEGITQEEKLVLEKLFAISQQIDELEREEAILTGEIHDLQLQADELEKEIEKMQADYDLQLDILKQVLVNYQKGGPASNIEILLRADNLSEFLKSINILKDISHNVNELLNSIEEDKAALEEDQVKLADKLTLLKQKEDALQENIHNNELLQKEQEEYLASLQEDKEFYQERLDNLNAMWADSKTLFGDIVTELSDIIGGGYFTTGDLHLSFGIFSMQGYIRQDSFQQLLKEHAKLPETVFQFDEGMVTIEVPEQKLVLTGNFVIEGEKAIRYEVEKGTFYDMELDTASIEELFQNGPLLLDFGRMAGDSITIDFELEKVESKEGKLTFTIIPQL